MRPNCTDRQQVDTFWESTSGDCMCRPSTHALHISAIEYATASVNTQVANQPQIMTGGPPVSTPMMRTPLSAIHEVTMLKEKPTIPTRPKLRFSSTLSLASIERFRPSTYPGYTPAVLARHHLHRRLPPFSPDLRLVLQTSWAANWVVAVEIAEAKDSLSARCERGTSAEVFIPSASVFLAAVIATVVHG